MSSRRYDRDHFPPPAHEGQRHAKVANPTSGTEPAAMTAATRQTGALDRRPLPTVALATLREWRAIAGIFERIERVDWKFPGFVCELGAVQCRAFVVGVGPAMAAERIAAALDSFPAQIVASCGYSGALTPDLTVGALVVGGESVRADDRSPPLPIGAACATARARLLTVDRPALTAGEKARLHDRYGAVAVDMETHAIAKVCIRLDIRMHSLRAISDGVDESIHPGFLRVLKPDGGLAIGALAALFARRPLLIGQAFRLARNTRAADSALRKGLRDLLSREVNPPAQSPS